MPKADKLILGANAIEVEKLIPEGFSFGGNAILKKLLRLGEFRLRGKELEDDESWRQLIAYMPVFNEYGKLLLYQRNDKHTETKLSGFWSCGSGGHIKDSDFGGDKKLSIEGIYKAAERELFEEVEFKSLKALKFYGFIWAKNPAVDRVHIGLVFIANIAGFIRCDKSEAQRWDFVDVQKDKLEYNFENWTRILLPHLKNF